MQNQAKIRERISVLVSIELKPIRDIFRKKLAASAYQLNFSESNLSINKEVTDRSPDIIVVYTDQVVELKHSIPRSLNMNASLIENIPVIVVSDKFDKTDVVHLMRQGICDVLEEIDLEDSLIEALDRAWDRRQYLREKSGSLDLIRLDLERNAKLHSRIESRFVRATERLVRLQEETKIANTDLVESQLKYKTLIDSAPNGFMTIGSTLGIIDFNPAMAKIMGFKGKEEIVNSSFIEHPFFRTGDVADKILDCLENRQEVSAEDEFNRNDVDLHKFIEFKVIPLADSDVLLSAEDVTLKRRDAKLTAKKDLFCSDTGLLRKEAFNPTVEKAISESIVNNSTLALVVIDIDNFKKFNDEYGHPGADAVLKSIGGRIIANISRNKDQGIRIGGDELAVVLVNFRAGSLHSIVHRLFAEISKPYKIVLPEKDATTVSCTFSIGVSEFRGQSAKELLVEADDAMYVSKNKLGKNHCYFSGEKLPTMKCVETKESVLSSTAKN